MDIDGFIDNLKTRTRSRETLRAYRQDLEKFEAFLKSRGLRATQASPAIIDQFIKELSALPSRKASQELLPASVSRRLSVLSSFYEFLRMRSNGRVSNPVAALKRPKVQNVEFRAVDEGTLSQLLSGISNLRDRALVAVFVASGLRLAELASLDKQAISRKQRRMPDGSMRTLGMGQVVGKGGKLRTFLLDEETVEIVVVYLKARGQDDNPALFMSSRQQRLSTRSIQDILHRHCRRLGLTRLHVHQLRHSFATRMVNAGMPSTVLRELMGHQSFTTTSRYFRIQSERLAREYFAAWEFYTPATVRTGAPEAPVNATAAKAQTNG
jgi:site-specific recombinase XerD